MTSNDLVIPAGIRLRIPSLLVFPGQVSCGEKPKAMVFPFCSRGALLRLMSTSEDKHGFNTTGKSNRWTSVSEAKRETTTKRKKKKHDLKMESETDSYLDWCCERFGATRSRHHH